MYIDTRHIAFNFFFFLFSLYICVLLLVRGLKNIRSLDVRNNPI